MANLLAATTFATGAKDDLAAVDVYKADGKTVINSIQSIAQRQGLNITSLFGNKLSQGTLSRILTMAGGTVGIDKATLGARLVQGSQSLKNSFGKLSESVKENMMKGIGDLNSPITTQINGITSMVDAQDFSDLKSFGGFVNEYTGNKGLFKDEDLDGMGAVVSGMINEGSRLGVENIYSTLTDGVENENLMCRVIQQTLPTVLKNSDLGTLHDMSRSKSGKSITALYPNFAEMLTSNYMERYSGRPQNSQTNYDRIVGSLFNLDSQWDRYSRGGGDLSVNLLLLMGGSSDFKYLLETGVKSLMDDNSEQKHYLLGNHFSASTVEAEVKRFFPKVYLATASEKKTTAKKKVLDMGMINDIGNLMGALL